MSPYFLAFLFLSVQPFPVHCIPGWFVVWVGVWGCHTSVSGRWSWEVPVGEVGCGVGVSRGVFGPGVSGPLVVVATVLDPYVMGPVGHEVEEEIRVWARANGLDPNEVRVGVGCPVEILSNGTIRWRQNVPSAEGKAKFEVVDGERRLVTWEVITPLVVPLPAHLSVRA